MNRKCSHYGEKKTRTAEINASADPRLEKLSLFGRFGLSQPDDPIALFPVATFLQQLQTLKTLQNTAFRAQRVGRSQA